jgi:MoxR-like ATPase
LINKEPVGSSDQLVAAIDAVHQVHVSDTFLEHVVNLIDRTRNHPAIELGCSPRAGIALIKSSRARALIQGRDYVVPDDLFALAEDAILHRIRLNYEALADGVTSEEILQEMLRDIGGRNEPAVATLVD